VLGDLDLEHNAIKDAGGKALAAGLRNNSALRALALEHNGLSRTTGEEVRAALEVQRRGQSAPLGSAPAQLLCLLRARLAALGSWALPGEEAGPRGAQPLPRVLERAT
jgi:hypothetical protein